MDSDSDEDRLVIVEEEGSGQPEVEAACEKAVKEENPIQEVCAKLIKEEPPYEYESPAKGNLSREIDVEVASKQKESSSDGRNGRQKRSCLPASLKERIIRSSSRTKALSAEDVELKKKQQPRLPKSVRFSKQDTKVVIKTEVDEEVNSSSEPPLFENDVCDLKPSVQKSAHPPHSEKPSQQRCRGAVSANPICGRKRVFSHPRLNSGQRVAQLIEPAETASCPKPRVHRKPKKIVPSDSDVAGSSKKPAVARRPRLASKKVIKQEPPEDQENVQEPSQPQKSTADNDEVSFLEKLMSEVDWKEKPTTKAKRGRPAKHVKGKGNMRISKAEPEQPQVTDVDRESMSKRLRNRPQREAAVPIKLESPEVTPEKPDQGSSSSSGDEFELKDNSDEEEFEERMSRASRRKLTRSLLRECNSLPARGSRRKTAQSTSVRKRVPRPCIEEHVEDDGIETFDTFLKYPNDIVCPETVEGFCSRPNDEMRKIYEDYMTNVRGEGVPEPDLERKLMEKLLRMEEELARLKEIKAKLEQEDDLGAEPFLDYVAYRLHPLNTRGEDRRLFGIHPEQLQNNSCALSDLSAAMWCVKPPKYIPLFRQKREFDDLSERLDALSGGGKQVVQDEEVDPIYMSVIREKIASAGNLVHEIRGRQFSHFDKVIKEEESAYGFDYYADGDNVAPQDHDAEPSLFSVVKKEEGEIPDDVDPYEEGLSLGAIDQDGNLFSWLSQ